MLILSQSTAIHHNGNRKKTHCKHGHVFDEANTYLNKNGGRACRTCHKGLTNRSNQTEVGKAKNRARAHAWQAAHSRQYLDYCKARRAKTNEWLNTIKSKGCARCGETFLACLDFHHRDPKKKLFAIGVRAGAVGLKALQEEVAKCDVICSNCHRKLHAAERGSDSVLSQEGLV